MVQSVFAVFGQEIGIYNNSSCAFGKEILFKGKPGWCLRRIKYAATAAQMVTSVALALAS